METPCLCPLEGHKYHSCKVLKTAGDEFCHKIHNLSLSDCMHSSSCDLLQEDVH